MKAKKPKQKERNNPLKKIKLSKNEARMLSVLGIVIVGWLCYRFIYTPQTEKLNALANEKIELEEEVDEINRVLKREGQINKDFIELNEEKEEILGRYFPSLEQSEMIYLMNGLTADDNVAVQNVSFDRPEDEEIADFEVQNMNVEMPYEGSYNGIMSVVKELRESPKKVLIDEIVMDRTDPNTLAGSIGVKIYTLDGISDSPGMHSGIIVEKSNNLENTEPFGSFYGLVTQESLASVGGTGIGTGIGTGFGTGFGTDYGDGLDGGGSSATGEVVEVDPYTYVTLMDFESKSSYFLPSQPHVKGAVSQSKLAKSKQYSLRFEYNILAVDKDDSNKAFIDVSKNKIELKYPPEDFRMWVHSYAFSPGTLALEFKTQTGEMITVIMSEGLGWTGWKQVYAEAIPTDLTQYPLMLDSISLEMPYGREDFGVLLTDKLEAVYKKNIDEEGDDHSVKENYFYHVADGGETAQVLSQIYYGTASYAKEINSLNELKEGEKLSKDQVIILKKRSVSESVFEESKKIPLPEEKNTGSGETFNHTVKRGENVHSISRKYYGTDAYVKEILDLNGMKMGDTLISGKVLKLKKR